jgi:thiol-disulfide isomerase/thioredoxin
MTRTPSTMLALGTRAPDFALPDTYGSPVSRADFAGKPLLVMFICNHCPYVKHVAGELARVGRDYSGKLGIVAISSNDANEYPEDSPEMMKLEKVNRGYNFPYLNDQTQQTARDFDAACTPDLFLFDASHKLVYRGQLDSSRPGNNIPVTGKDLRAALDALLAGRTVNPEQLPSVGCNIKWRRG